MKRSEFKMDLKKLFCRYFLYKIKYFLMILGTIAYCWSVLSRTSNNEQEDMSKWTVPGFSYLSAYYTSQPNATQEYVYRRNKESARSLNKVGPKIRAEYMHSKCNDLKKSFFINSNEFLVNHKYKLIWCNVFKAASTTWMFNYLRLSNISEANYLKYSSPVDMVRKKYPRPSKTALLKVLSDPAYSSFLIVRHPFERLISSFKSKLETLTESYYSDLRCQIQKKYSSRRVVNIMGFKICYPKFSEFVAYLIDENKKRQEPLDMHFMSVYDFCSPCEANFTYVLKFEHLSQEEKLLIEELGLPRSLLRQKVNNSRSNYTKLAKKYFGQLTYSQFMTLYNIYQKDFYLFGYDPNEPYYKYVKKVAKNQPSRL